MGVLSQFLILSISVLAIVGAIYRTKQGAEVKLRRIACLDVLDELVGRSAEMGKPIHIITGCSALTGSEAPIVSAGLAMLGYVAELCGKYRIPMMYNMDQAYVIPIAQDLIKTGYTKAGVPEMYNDDMIYFTGGGQKALESRVQSYIYREKPTVNMLFGGIKYEAMNSLGAAASVGCIQAAGTPRLYYNAFLAACCDYSMIGDELYAAVATIKGIPEEKAVIMGQDIIKLVTMIMLVISAILSTAGLGDLYLRYITM